MFALVIIAWTVGVRADMVPNLEVSLEPPTDPFPEISTKIGNMETSRETFEEASMGLLVKSHNAALQQLKTAITQVVGNAMHAFADPSVSVFVESAMNGSARGQRTAAPTFVAVNNKQHARGEDLSVKINVLPGMAVDPTIENKIASIDGGRYQQEKQFFESAAADTRALTTFFISEVEGQLQAQVNAIKGFLRRRSIARGFLRAAERNSRKAIRALPKQANIQIVTSDVPYPTVASLVQDMQSRRDVTENLATAKVLDMQMNMLKAANLMLKEALSDAIPRILVK